MSKMPTSSRPWPHKVVLLASSFFGLGYLPLAPGTWGTVGALGVWWSMRDLTLPWFVGLTLAICAFAVWVAGRAEALYGSHDVQHIVIDEVAGLLVTVIGVPWRWQQVLTAFVVFRLLDSLKPPPIRWFDRHVEGGFGVVIDDIVAGLVGCALLHIAHRIWGGWW